MNVTTLCPSPSASEAGTDTSCDASPSPGASASPSPSSTGSGGGSRSFGASTKTITDKSIRGNVLVRFSQEPSLRGIQFKVAVHDAVVILAGRVTTKEHKRSAEQIAVSEPVVKRVLSYIVITGGGGY